MVWLPVTRKVWGYVYPFRQNTGVWQTNRWMDGQTDRQTSCRSIVNAMHTRRAVSVSFTEQFWMYSACEVTSSLLDIIRQSNRLSYLLTYLLTYLRSWLILDNFTPLAVFPHLSSIHVFVCATRLGIIPLTKIWSEVMWICIAHRREAPLMLCRFPYVGAVFREPVHSARHQRRLQDHRYGLVYHRICLFTLPAFAGCSFQPNHEGGIRLSSPGCLWFCAEVVYPSTDGHPPRQ